jgi:ElaB/YqjD/DUF883 family membrane-anchored ribosome-binding protein
MTDEEIEKIEDELQQARENLSQTLQEVNRKVETQLDVESVIRGRPLLALGLAGAGGFVLGLSSNSVVPLAAVLLGAAAGFSLRKGEPEL